MPPLLIWASPNKDGLTAAARDSLLEGMAAEGVRAEVPHLNRSKLESCRACGDGWGTCRSAGTCIIKDDFAAIYEKLEAAAALVWVTPVYWHDIAENMKCLLDRLRRCETAHNHRLRRKENLLVACAGGTGYGAVECLHNLEQPLEHMGMTALDRLPVIQFNRGYMLPALHGAGQALAVHLRQG